MSRFGEPQTIVIDSGQTTSAPFFTAGGPERLTILTPSRTPGAPVFLRVGPSSAGPFGRMQTSAGSDSMVVVSGQAIVAGVVNPFPPAIFARVEVGVATTAPNTFTIIGGVSR
jgi:hypothetical protein